MPELTIWKYTLDPYKSSTTLEIPEGGIVLSSHVQNCSLCIWVQVDPTAIREKRHFIFVGTGHAIPFGHNKFIGTCLLDGGSFVFHVFELLDGEAKRKDGGK